MSYNYEAQKAEIFTDEGQREFLKVRDHVKHCLEVAGAVVMSKAYSVAHVGSSWNALALVDRLVELGEIEEVPQHPLPAGQDRIFRAKNWRHQ